MQLRALWSSSIAVAAIAFVLGGPVQAQTSTATTQASTGKPLALGKYTKQRSRHARKAATRSSHHSIKKTAKTSSTSERSGKDKAKTTAKDNDAKDRAKTASVRKAAEGLSAVADARAELKADDQKSSPPSFNDITATATDNPNTSEPAAAPRTLSDLDKAAMAASTLDTTVVTPAATTSVKMASAAPEPSASISSQTASSHDDIGDTWDRTSLIGKIFVAFGGLLTLASAARMFMA